MKTNLLPLVAALCAVASFSCHPEVLEPFNPPPHHLECMAEFDDCVIHPSYMGECISGLLILENIEVFPEYLVVRGSRAIYYVYALKLNNECSIPKTWLAQQENQSDGSVRIPISYAFYVECWLAGNAQYGQATWDAEMSYPCGGAYPAPVSVD